MSVNELTLGTILGNSLVFEVSNLPTHIPANSLSPKVNAGCVNHSPFLVPVDLAVVLLSKAIFIA